MSDSDILNELTKLKIDITPGAAEVLKNSHVPKVMIIKEVKEKWTTKSKAITVKDAINLMLESDKYIQASRRKVHEELKESVELSSQIPRLLRRSFYTLKRIDQPASAGEVAIRTHRKTNTERIYLNQLSDKGLITKIQTEEGKTLYSISEID